MESAMHASDFQFPENLNLHSALCRIAEQSGMPALRQSLRTQIV
jgi:hypothetical protein